MVLCTFVDIRTAIFSDRRHTTTPPLNADSDIVFVVSHDVAQTSVGLIKFIHCLSQS